jgi:hypothetical protein
MTKNKKNHNFNHKVALSVMVTVAVTVMASVFGGVATFLQISLVNVPQHAPFDGTTFPVKKVPNWVKLSAGKYGQSYGEFKSSELMDLPAYDSDRMNTSSNDGKNAMITYPVVYMGNYEYDHVEGAGSHPAIDIKTPEGTPIYAIANGTVLKASTQSDGFGHHVVLQHNNFPSLESKNVKETLFSSYSHLSDVSVSQNQVVRKGELLGYSGMTGTASSPHLHFQIDTEEASWHPFWPFTWTEVRAAGLDFFSAINAGLGKESAMDTTINPMKYVQRYMGGDALYTVDSEDTASDSEDNSDNESDGASSYINEDNTDNNDNADANVDSQTTDNSSDSDEEAVFSGFKVDVDSTYYVGRGGTFQITTQDQFGKKFPDGFIGEIIVTANNGNFTADEAILTTLDFSNGEYTGSFSRMEAGKDKVKVEYNDETFYSDRFEISEDNATISFKDISAGSKYHDSIMYLAEKGIVNGYSDGTFKPTKYVTRAEGLKLIMEGTNTSLASGKLSFKDVKSSDWAVKYIYTAQKKKIASGYGDNTFKPNNTVSKAEFLKILFNTMDIEVTGKVAVSPYSDVDSDTWYAAYFAKAKELGVFGEVANINPSASMTRQEVADAIYRVMTAVEA